MGSPHASDAATADSWPAYLLGTLHTSFKKEAITITTLNAGSLHVAWTWLPDPGGVGTQQLFATPTISGGKVYVGANTGDFYALSETTGAVVWKTFIGATSSCGGGRATPGRGITSTATVAQDPLTHAATVYVGGGDGFLYALDAGTGVVKWASQVVGAGGYNWASPTVIGGHVYMGVSALEDCGLIRAGLKEYDQATGALQHIYWSVPRGSVGASIWTSAGVTSDDASVFVTTGDALGPNFGDAYSMVKLSGSTLAKTDIWTIPGVQGTDVDWGASPTLFSAKIGPATTPMVGACAKNGIYYALNQGSLSAGPVWSRQIGKSGQGYCLAASVFDGKRLYVGSNQTTIGTTSYNGSIRQLNPATGVPVWQTGLGGTVVGSPAMDGANVLAVPTWDYEDPGATNTVYLVNSTNGVVLGTIDTLNDGVYAQPVFSGIYLFVATQDNGLTAYTP